MKKSVLLANIILILFAFSGMLLAGLTLQYFTAKTNSDGIFIEWKTADEGGTTRFEIERSATNPDNFIYIKTINATGNNSYYSFLDNTVNKLESNSIYYYRLKCIQSNSTYSYSNTISVVHTISGIKNTWGSIKAIFR